MSSTRQHAAKRKANRKTAGRARIAQRRTMYDQWPFKGPSISSVRRWMKAGEAAGDVERTVDTTRAGHPHMWSLTVQGKQKMADTPSDPDLGEWRTDAQAKKIARAHGLTYDAALLVMEHARKGRQR